MSRFTILTDAQIHEALADVPEWEVRDSKLQASYEFADFRTAFAFMTLVAEEAEKLDHHPEWTNVYNRVTISLSTHDAGGMVTDLDIVLARAISEAAKKFL